MISIYQQKQLFNVTAILKPYLFSHYVCVYVFVYLF